MFLPWKGTGAKRFGGVISATAPERFSPPGLSRHRRSGLWGCRRPPRPAANPAPGAAGLGTPPGEPSHAGEANKHPPGRPGSGLSPLAPERGRERGPVPGSSPSPLRQTARSGSPAWPALTEELRTRSGSARPGPHAGSANVHIYTHAGTGLCFTRGISRVKKASYPLQNVPEPMGSLSCCLSSPPSCP